MNWVRTGRVGTQFVLERQEKNEGTGNPGNGALARAIGGLRSPE
jgi:hypothetical protein